MGVNYGRNHNTFIASCEGLGGGDSNRHAESRRHCHARRTGLQESGKSKSTEAGAIRLLLALSPLVPPALDVT